jgi:hypothetical protein
VFYSSSSVPASGENSGLEVVTEQSHATPMDVLRIGVTGGANLCMALAVVGDEGVSSGCGEDVRKMSAAAAVMGAMVVSVFTLPLPNYTRHGCLPVSMATCPHDLWRCDRLRSSASANIQFCGF